MRVADVNAVDVGDRERKPARCIRPSASRASTAGEMWAAAPPRISASACINAVAELPQGFAAEQRRHEKAVRLERVADLDQAARQVVDPVKREAGDDKVQARVGERRAAPRPCEPAGSLVGRASPREVGLDQEADALARGAARQGRREGAVARAEVDGEREVAHNGLQAFDEVGRGAVLEEVGVGECRRRAIQALAV